MAHQLMLTAKFNTCTRSVEFFTATVSDPTMANQMPMELKSTTKFGHRTWHHAVLFDCSIPADVKQTRDLELVQPGVMEQGLQRGRRWHAACTPLSCMMEWSEFLFLQDGILRSAVIGGNSQVVRTGSPVATSRHRSQLSLAGKRLTPISRGRCL